MYEYNPCVGCEYYNQPYWSVVSPCKSCPRQQNYTGGYVVTTTTTLPVEYAIVRHGKWIYDHWCEFKCSECGEWSNSKPYKGREKYCPNCGAQMDLEE